MTCVVGVLYLGWEMYIMCTSHPDFVCLLFVPSLHYTLYLYVGTAAGPVSEHG